MSLDNTLKPVAWEEATQRFLMIYSPLEAQERHEDNWSNKEASAVTAQKTS